MGLWRRLLALVMAAVALSAAQVPNTVASEQPNAAPKSVSNGSQNVAEAEAKNQQAERVHRLKYEAQCDPANEQRDSDLCAQWKAADAAADSAWWAARATWVSGISGILVLIALGFAFEANRIAATTAQKQLRAYVGCPDVWIQDVGTEGRFKLINYGQTPAFEVKATCLMMGRKADSHRVGILDPRQEGVSRFGIPGIVRREASVDYITETLRLDMEIVYRDIHGCWWERCQSFVIECGDPIKLRQGGHIADFSRTHGSSSEREIKAPSK
jgi:hypothetical protein